MIGLIRSLLQNCIDRIDAGNSNISADEEIEIIESRLQRYLYNFPTEMTNDVRDTVEFE